MSLPPKKNNAASLLAAVVAEKISPLPPIIRSSLTQPKSTIISLRSALTQPNSPTSPPNSPKLKLFVTRRSLFLVSSPLVMTTTLTFTYTMFTLISKSSPVSTKSAKILVSSTPNAKSFMVTSSNNSPKPSPILHPGSHNKPFSTNPLVYAKVTTSSPPKPSARPSPMPSLIAIIYFKAPALTLICIPIALNLPTLAKALSLFPISLDPPPQLATPT